jgi:DNA-directed RNA polymerase alpha subunit
MPNFGKKSLKILKEYLDKYGLKLNTDLKDIKYEALKSLNLVNLKHDYLFVEKRGFMK